MEPRRFVVLRHEPGEAGPRALHWDVMLEFGDSLRTWALSREPFAGEQIVADELPRHRSAYLDYEGQVSQGRGIVTRFDAGSFDVQEESHDSLVVTLQGNLLKGSLRLSRDTVNQRWTVAFAPN